MTIFQPEEIIAECRVTEEQCQLFIATERVPTPLQLLAAVFSTAGEEKVFTELLRQFRAEACAEDFGHGDLHVIVASPSFGGCVFEFLRVPRRP